MDVLLGAFELVSARLPNCHLLVCGDGIERARLAARAAATPARERVHFLGERRDVGAILRDATDVFVSASRDEAFPLTLLEAGYFGLPIVATAIPPHREFLGDEGRIGVLTAVDDAGALAGALERFALDGEARRACGEKVSQRVRATFLVSHVVQQFEALYARLLERPRAEFQWLRGTTVPRSYLRWARQRVAGRISSDGDRAQND
jgi:glycosyltransferase involved in cell wall biosynthesis